MNRSNYVIVVIEDNEADAEVLRLGLTEAGRAAQKALTIRPFSNGVEALRYLEAPDPPCNLILLDIYLPGLSGPEVLEAIRGKEPLSNLPVLMLSGSLDPRERKHCENLGATGFLPKTGDLQKLMSMCREIVERL